MEIRTEAKTLRSVLFNSPDGVIQGETFTPTSGVVYTVVNDHEFEGVRMKRGMTLKLAIKNKRKYHYMVS